jgi:hypothetical protein
MARPKGTGFAPRYLDTQPGILPRLLLARLQGVPQQQNGGGSMRPIRLLLIVFIVAVGGVLAYNYWTGNGWTLQPSPNASTGVDAEKARERGVELARKAAETTKVAAERTGEVVGEATLTAKIKSKMALDDYVKARTINVDTTGTTVTLTGTVHSEQERERALRLARETEGIKSVVDKLQVK